ncbi:alpha/beta hydrolase [Rhodotorula paludigena]|uniref:alpha/beta hydrolase n=1 Tax=Rhodotorula paludigena TaxID=86838 RepID=UPI0031724053
MGILRRAHIWILYAFVAYVAFLVSLIYEPVQRGLIYLHGIRIPFGADFSRPESVGFAPGKVLPFRLTTPDGATLGAWHVLPVEAYEAALERYGVPAEGHLPEAVFDAALRNSSYPTVLYNHGNAGTRAAGNRVRVARHMSALNANFVIYDYRGFADSSRDPPPSEEGLLTDARAAWDWLTKEKGVEEGRISVMGQSLGTGVSAGLVGRLADEGVSPRSLILVAPFSSIATLLETYRLGNFIPILSPLRNFPWLLDALLQLLKTRFDTKNIIEKITSPILILHAQNDPVIPFSHSRVLADVLINPLLAKSGPSEKDKARGKLVRETQAGGWGVVSSFERGEGKGRVVWAEAREGAHNEIGTSEYSIELIKQMVHGEVIKS